MTTDDGQGSLFDDDEERDDDVDRSGESSTPYQRHSDTSREAAAQLDGKGRHGRLLLQVFAMIRDAGEHGMTVAELMEQGGLMYQSTSARVSELARGKYGRMWIRDNGQRRVAAYSGRRQAVYIVNDRPLTPPPAP